MTNENLPAANDATNGIFAAPPQSGTEGIEVAIRRIPEGEVLERAREAYIATRRPWNLLTRQIRKGRFDWRLRAVARAIRDMQWPIEALLAKEEIAVAGLAIKATPLIADLDAEHQQAVASAIMTALRVQRRR